MRMTMRAGPPPLRALIGLIAAVLATACSVLSATGQDAKSLRIGVLAYRGSEEAERSFATTQAALQKALPDYKVEMIPGSAAFLTAAVAGHRLDFLITNPGHFLELEIGFSARAIATEQDMDGTSANESVAATVVVPGDSPDIWQLPDLKGRRLAAVAPDAFGYRAAQREFLERGIDLEQDVILHFVGFPVEGVLQAIQSGRADAGVVRSCLIEKMLAEGVIHPDEFKVIGRRPSGTQACQVSSRLYPGWPFVRVAQTPEPLAKAVAAALLSMQPDSGTIVWSPPEDYQSVQDLYRALKVGPYAPFSRLGMMDLAWQYRYWAGLFVLAVLWWIVHTARVAHLLRRRTAELKRAHELSRIKSEQMEHTQRLSLMGEMASSLAHEINQPLAAILSYARGCERRLASGNDIDGVRAGVERIAQQAERAGAIVRRMREFVRKQPSRQVSVDPGAILHDALGLFEPTANARRIRIEADIQEPLPAIMADRLQIEEVLINLLQNALDAVAQQPLARIQLRAGVFDHVLRVSVTDNGPGIAPGSVPLLFEAFFTTKSQGLGLGLSLSRTIIEAHGGHLEVDIKVPGETTFWFALPLAEEPVGV
jgi:two-component system sensor histidine kinase TtrS